MNRFFFGPFLLSRVLLLSSSFREGRGPPRVGKKKNKKRGGKEETKCCGRSPAMPLVLPEEIKSAEHERPSTPVATAPEIPRLTMPQNPNPVLKQQPVKVGI